MFELHPLEKVAQSLFTNRPRIATLFLNHDCTKIKVPSPLLLNLSLFFVFAILTFITIRKTVGDKPLSVLQTNQMKGLAILSIIIGHLSFHTIENTDLSLFLNKFSPSGLALFLIISGLGISLSLKKKGIKGFFLEDSLEFTCPLS